MSSNESCIFLSIFKTENETEVADNETTPLATEMVQIVYDCPDYYANEMPSPRVSASELTIDNTMGKKKVKKKVKKNKIFNEEKSNPLQTNENDENDDLMDEMKYKCSECGRRFKKGWNLKEHMQRHSDLRPFACWLCHKT